MNIKLCEACKNSGLTNTQIAKEVKITQGYFSLIKHGRRRPSPEKATAICKALGGAVTVMELLYPNDPPAALDQPQEKLISASNT